MGCNGTLPGGGHALSNDDGRAPSGARDQQLENFNLQSEAASIRSDPMWPDTDYNFFKSYL